MSYRFLGKVAIITGGASGIGKATALHLSKEGAKVVIFDIKSRREGIETIRLIEKGGGEVLYVQGDVSNAIEVQKMLKKTIEKFGAIIYRRCKTIPSLSVSLSHSSRCAWIHSCHCKGRI